MPHWTTADIPDQRGRVALVTGANSGIGHATARALARHGATVVLACRDDRKARHAADAIGAPTVETLHLDLADPASIRDAAAELHDRHPRLDFLVNNAGITGVTGRTPQGHEIQLAVNHLGHFALTGLLLPLLLATENSRVVTVASIAHRFGDTTDLTGHRGAYARAKLANLQFTGGLHRRLTANAAATTALAAHPGGAATAVFRHGNALVRAVNLGVAKAFGRTPEMGALPTLRAATDPAAEGGEYYGPTGLFEIAGYPGTVTASKKANDRAAQDSLWARSEELTGVAYAFTPAGSAGR